MPFRVRQKDLKQFFRSLLKHSIRGLNVTIPHKQAVIPFMHSLSREARAIGAVNTITIKNKTFYGHNTDGKGYITSLAQQAKLSVSNKRVLLLGAGGAARAILVALGMEKTKSVHVANRTANKAFELILQMDKRFPQTKFSASSLEDIKTTVWTSCDLVVNTTSMGMKGSNYLSLPLSKLSAQAVVSDIVYTPLETPLLKNAKKLGLKTHPGWGMLLYQGALSFQLWTGKKAPLKIMQKALLEALKK